MIEMPMSRLFTVSIIAVFCAAGCGKKRDGAQSAATLSPSDDPSLTGLLGTGTGTSTPSPTVSYTPTETAETTYAAGCTVRGRIVEPGARIPIVRSCYIYDCLCQTDGTVQCQPKYYICP